MRIVSLCSLLPLVLLNACVAADPAETSASDAATPAQAGSTSSSSPGLVGAGGSVSSSALAGAPAAGGAGAATGSSAAGGAATATSGGAAPSGGALSNGAAGTATTAVVPPAEGTRVVGYYAGWSTYERNFQVSQIRADLLTHINYAFANVSASGECEVGDPWADLQKTFAGDDWQAQAADRAGNFNQLRQLKTQHPKLRTLISVGGWTWSGRLSDVAATDAGRQRFAQSCAAFVEKHGFDGLDLDWEYPVEGGLDGNAHRPEDAENFVLLLQALRAALDTTSGSGPRHLLTIAAAAGPNIFQHQDLARVAAPLDWINLMTYDFNGAWSTFVAHDAPLYQSPHDPSRDPVVRERWNASAAVQSYLDAGVPAAKLNLGVPFYGRGFAGVPSTDHGLFQQASAAPTAGTWEAGVFDYKDLAKNYVGVGDFKRYWDSDSQVPFLYSESRREFISYDDAESLQVKGAFAKAHGLGAMIWDLSSDDASATLLGALNRGLATP